MYLVEPPELQQQVMLVRQSSNITDNYIEVGMNSGFVQNGKADDRRVSDVEHAIAPRDNLYN